MATRRERVVLDLESNLPEGMLRGAAATTVLRKELERLSGQSVITSRASANMSRDVDKMSDSARKADTSINQLTGRLRVLADVAAILGPSLAPLGGVAVAGVAGLANQMGFAAVAGGVLIGSLQGVGDALGAMNKAQLDPTNKNLQAAKEALERLSPAAQDFADAAFDLKPALVALRDIGAEAVLPGLTESLDNLERLGPQVGGIMEAIGGALGDIASDASASLASERWADFFSFIETEGPTVLGDLATTVGDLTHGLSELWMAFEPLNSGFSSWLMDVADGFDDWATGLSATEGFAEFVDYIQTTGPQLSETLGAIANAVVQIVQATAPLAGPVLSGLEAAADAIGAIADSDLGTPIFAGVAALALLNRSLAVTAALSKTSLSGGLFAGLGTVATGAKQGAGGIKTLTGDIGLLSRNYLTAGKSSERMAAQNKKALDSIKGTAKAVGPAAGLMGGLALASSGAADGLGLTNTASLALMGSLGGPPGIAIGAAAGALLDLKAAGEGSTAAIDGLNAAIQSGDLDTLRSQIEAAKAELADINDLDFGGDIFDRIGFQVADTFGGKSADEAAAEIKRAEQAVEDLADAEAAREGASRRAALTYASEAGLNADLSKWRSRSVEEIKAQADAMLKAREAAQKTATSFVNLGDSLDDGKVSLGGWIKEMAESADALRNFMNNARTAAKRGLDDGLIASLQEAGDVGARRMKQLANATDEEINKANRAWRRGEKAIEDYNNFVVPPKKPKVDVSQSISEIERLEARLRAIKDESVNVVVRQIGSTTLGPRNEAADGATVPKTGKPYADRHLYLLADGEEVISNRHGQADRHRSLLKSINANRRLAEGGTAGDDEDGKKKRRPRNYFNVTDNTKALEAAIERLTGVSANQTAAVEAQRGALEKATGVTEMWAEKMSSLASATVAGFNTGLFERDSNVWAAGAGGGAISNLTRDIAGLNERSGLQAQLAGMGLSGDALAALLSQGDNQDIAGLIASGQVSQYADLFAQRAALQGSVGAAAGQQAYGPEYAAARAYEGKQFAALQAQLATQQRTEAKIGSLEAQISRMAVLVESFERTGAERIAHATDTRTDRRAAAGFRARNG